MRRPTLSAIQAVFWSLERRRPVGPVKFSGPVPLDPNLVLNVQLVLVESGRVQFTIRALLLSETQAESPSSDTHTPIGLLMLSSPNPWLPNPSLRHGQAVQVLLHSVTPRTFDQNG